MMTSSDYNYRSAFRCNLCKRERGGEEERGRGGEEEKGRRGEGGRERGREGERKIGGINNPGKGKRKPEYLNHK